MRRLRAADPGGAGHPNSSDSSVRRHQGQEAQQPHERLSQESARSGARLPAAWGGTCKARLTCRGAWSQQRLTPGFARSRRQEPVLA